MKSNIVLVGFMGTGKTAVGKRLAAILNKKFYDTDHEIEKVTGLNIQQILRKHGEKRFQSEEDLAIKRLARKENSVIAIGGGVVLDSENTKFLTENGIIICLTAEPEVVYERVKRRNSRPLLKKVTTYDSITEMMVQRDDLNKYADFHVDTSNLEFQEIIEQIIKIYRENN